MKLARTIDKDYARVRLLVFECARCFISYTVADETDDSDPA